MGINGQRSGVGLGGGNCEFTAWHGMAWHGIVWHSIVVGVEVELEMFFPRAIISLLALSQDGEILSKYDVFVVDVEKNARYSVHVSMSIGDGVDQVSWTDRC
jgi:hypothetical protein